MQKQRDIHKDFESVTEDADSARWREAGAALGRSHWEVKPLGRGKGQPNRRNRMRDLIARTAANPQGLNAEWVLDNFRLIFGSEKAARDFCSRAGRYPAAVCASGAAMPRISLVARRYLEEAGNVLNEDGFAAFLDGFQDVAHLNIAEIWALKAALLLELIDRLSEADPFEYPAILTSMAKISEANWKEFFERVSYTHRVLAQDPAGAYSRMDFDGREQYREAIAALSKYSPLTEREIAEAAIDFCEDEFVAADGSRAAARRTHVGYYLVDGGRSRLESVIEYRPPLAERIPRFILRHPAVFYLAGIELLTLAVVFAVLSNLNSLSIAACAGALLLLFLPASQASVDFINNLLAFVIRPKALPKLDFSEGVPAECSTMVAVPSLLLSEAQVHDLVLDLEIRFLANRDRNLHFALLTDSPDSESSGDENQELVERCVELIKGLNRRYRGEGRAPFFLFHRRLAYNASENRWMGWERKRGKLMEFNKLLRGGSDAFPVKVGDLAVLPHIRYVITLDSDTQLPRDSAARLIGTIAHPLNQAIVDPQSHMVVEGYGILQPRMGISIQSASRSRLAAFYSGQTGFDIYTRAVSDIYQDLFGEGIFAGKGVYEVNTLREVLEHRFPQNALLSHDLIEGVYARAALATDIDLIDDYPSHFSAYSRRRHRWVRGDWQIMRWIRSRVPDFFGRTIANPIPLISRWKIADNLRRSLLEPALILLLLSGWLWLPGGAGFWTSAAVLLWFVPVLSALFFGLARIPDNHRELSSWVRETARTVWDNSVATVCSLIFLLDQALVSADAIVRALARVFVTKKKLLEWETAAEAENASGRKATVDTYLEWCPWLTIVLALTIALVHPAALPAAAPLLFLWIASPVFSHWLNRRPRTGHSQLRHDEVQLLRESADRIWRFFHEWSTSSTNYLIPDWVRENGAVELRLSPTNLGMLLNARIAAVHMGVLPLAEFVLETRQTLDCVLALPKYRGHLFNWYEISTLTPSSPRYVSSVDSGNLAGGLWTLKQAALAFAAESVVKRGVTKDLAVELRNIAEICDRLVREMDFRFLYQRQNRTLSIGYNTDTERLDDASYNLLASEARMAVFIAIAKGDIPQNSWFRLSRSHTLCRGEHVMLSWTGTMFEYLMPQLWMRSYPDTVVERSLKVAVRAQREFGRRHGVPWGVSESAYIDPARNDYGYAPFGVPQLAVKRHDANQIVISPYSTFLGAMIEPGAAVQNLRQMEEFGWFGRYGFYEAIDYTQGGGEPARMWMAHHQGMALLATVNLLYDNPMRQYFHAEPQVMATELLLHERLQANLLAEADSVPLPEFEPAAA
jgi:cyclic beta-1,2-glucan synthetase